MNLPSNLPTLLRAAGLTVVEIDGWQTRARPASTGGFAPVGVLNHHTGALDRDGDLADDLAYAKWLATTGRDDLPPPVVQLTLSHEGTVYILAAGRSNHAGIAKPSGSVAGGDGNTLYVGIEWMLSGTQFIPITMYKAGVTLNAVLLHILGSSERAVSCHYQTSVTGKWDIGDPEGIEFNGHRVLDVDELRANVYARTLVLYPKDPSMPPASDLQLSIMQARSLDGTIDGHDPLVVTFRIKGTHGWFRVTFVYVNWGRGYTPVQFHNNVIRVLNHVGEREYVILCMQEIDEADPSPEHLIIRKEMEPGTTLVEWHTREPIAVSPGVTVHRERKTVTMASGKTLGMPGLGPMRYFVSCIVVIEGVRIGIGNQHPHRNVPDHVVQHARAQGERVTKHEVHDLVDRCDLVVHGGDMNDTDYPKSYPTEKVAYERGLDTIRYIVA